MTRKRFSPYSFGLFMIGLFLILVAAFVAVRWLYPAVPAFIPIAAFAVLAAATGRLGNWGAAHGYLSCPACGHQANHPGRANEYVSHVRYRP